MLIRLANPADLPLIRTLEQQSETAAHWSDRDYAALFAPEAPKQVSLVASAAGETNFSGFIIARVGGDEWEIENIVVAGEHRRQGIGRALVNEILRTAQEHGAQSVLLEVRESNTAARQLYDRLGFVETARRHNYYRDPVEDALLLSLTDLGG